MNSYTTSALLERIANLSETGLTCLSSSLAFGFAIAELRNRGVDIDRQLFWQHASCNRPNRSGQDTPAGILLELASLGENPAGWFDFDRFLYLYRLGSKVGIRVHPFLFWKSTDQGFVSNKA